MDTKVKFNKESRTFTKYSEAEEYILSKLRYWNNFEYAPVNIEVVKETSETDTLNVSTNETIRSTDIFGRQ